MNNEHRHSASTVSIHDKKDSSVQAGAHVCIDGKKESRELWQAREAHLEKLIDLKIHATTTVGLVEPLQPDEVKMEVASRE